MIYKEALWAYIILGLFCFGFDLAIIYHAEIITAAKKSLRLTFIGKCCTRALLIWITYQALEYPEGTLGWQYWLATIGASMSLVGMIIWVWEIRHIPQRRSTDPERRRDDKMRGF